MREIHCNLIVIGLYEDAAVRTEYITITSTASELGCCRQRSVTWTNADCNNRTTRSAQWWVVLHLLPYNIHSYFDDNNMIWSLLLGNTLVILQKKTNCLFVHLFICFAGIYYMKRIKLLKFLYCFYSYFWVVKPYLRSFSSKKTWVTELINVLYARKVYNNF